MNLEMKDMMEEESPQNEVRIDLGVGTGIKIGAHTHTCHLSVPMTMSAGKCVGKPKGTCTD